MLQQKYILKLEYINHNAIKRFYSCSQLFISFKRIAVHTPVSCICLFFIFLIGGYREYVCPFYIVSQVTKPLPKWPIWHHMKCYTRSKGKPATNKHQEKLLNSMVSNHVVHTHLQMTYTKGLQLLLKRGWGGRYLNVRDIMRSKRNIALKISITLQAYDSSGSL